MQKNMFLKQEDFKHLSDILDKWTQDEMNMKDAFLRLCNRFSEKNQAVLSVVSRPGISYSLRARMKADAEEGTLITMIDIVDDDPDDRWLSVCFYGDCVTDPEEEGDLVPGGLLGEDGHCFDLYENNQNTITYLEQRIDEAYENTVKNQR
ncbi:MAG: hypothetical protein JRD04_00940 [Deltaproteobacteria bacterium]|nr:hypothetical protein [Deltaproteobacteria bacterium]